ncbi:beta-N-acetylhexosaminidase, partial [Nonomuraea aridisoli]
GRARDGFGERLERHLGRLDALGVEYRPPAGPRPWQRRRPHRPSELDMRDRMARIEEMTYDAESTRPSM